MGGDYFPWSELEELEYEIWASKEEVKRYNETMAQIDAEGGDVSHEIEDAKLAEERGETLTPEQKSLLDGIRKRL